MIKDDPILFSKTVYGTRKIESFLYRLLLVKTSLIIAQLAYSHNERYRCVQVMTIFIC